MDSAFLSIFSAVMITMIGVGVQYKGGQNISITTETNLYTAFSGVTQIMFAYCAHVAFFGLIAEMEEPKDFPKALCLLQGFEISLYVTAAIVIYYYVGNGVDSPALGSAGPVLKKVAYGMAIPTVSPSLYVRRGLVLMVCRLSVPVWSTDMLVSNTSTCVSSASRVACTRTTGSRWDPGLALA